MMTDIPPEEAQIIALGQKIYNKVGDLLTKMVLEGDRPNYLYAIDIAIGVAIGKRQHKDQDKRLNQVRKVINQLGYITANEESHNVIGHCKLVITMAGNFFYHAEDPQLIKVWK